MLDEPVEEHGDTSLAERFRTWEGGRERCVRQLAIDSWVDSGKKELSFEIRMDAGLGQLLKRDRSLCTHSAIVLLDMLEIWSSGKRRESREGLREHGMVPDESRVTMTSRSRRLL